MRLHRLLDLCVLKRAALAVGAALAILAPAPAWAQVYTCADYFNQNECRFNDCYWCASYQMCMSSESPYCNCTYFDSDVTDCERAPGCKFCDELTPSCRDSSWSCTCGNGAWDPGEECDGVPNCAENCKCLNYYTHDGAGGCVPICGDGVMIGDEECEHAGGHPTAHCTDCRCDSGWVSDPEGPVYCTPDCGDGVTVEGEECDSVQYCGADCSCLPGYAVSGTNVCSPIPGDGIIVPGEDCTSEADGVICPPSHWCHQEGTCLDGECVNPLVDCSDGNPCTDDGCATSLLLSSGAYHACVLSANGEVTCWGRDTELQASAPVGTFVDLAAGGYHTCALTHDGNVLCWGSNGYNQGGFHAGPYTAVAAGVYHSCALDEAGSVACWGANNQSQCSAPPGPFSAVFSGGEHGCGLSPEGEATCWGRNDYGQAESRLGPYVLLALGGYHTCGLTAGGVLDCWGRNDDSQSTVLSGTYVAVSAGGYHTCAIRSDDGLACWGKSDDGRLEVPEGAFSEVSAGWHSTCALRTVDATVVCWGDNSFDLQNTPEPGSWMCRNAINDANACDDGDLCTQTASCQDGLCTGSDPVICGALDQCHDAGQCNPETGLCSNPTKVDGTACDDEDLCTQTDTCQEGLCTGSDPVICEALDQCHDAGQCNPESGLCSNPTKVDGTACSGGTCIAGICTPSTDGDDPPKEPPGCGCASGGKGETPVFTFLLLLAFAALRRRFSSRRRPLWHGPSRV